MTPRPRGRVARTPDGEPVEYRHVAGGIEVACGQRLFVLAHDQAEAHAWRLLHEVARARAAGITS